MTDHTAIQAKLEERLRELTERANQIDDDLSKPGDDDWEENAIEAEDDEVLSGVGRAALEEMRRIRLALSAIALGKYGVCSECGAKIVPERLEALPEATRCKRCA